MKINIKLPRLKPYRGFTLAESFVVMAIVSVLIIVSMPALTTRKATKVRVDNITQECIINQNGKLSSDACKAAIERCKLDKGNSCNTLMRYVANDDKDNSTNKKNALKILKDVCEDGGLQACDVFIDRCIADYDNCNIDKKNSLAKLDLNYFLSLPSNDSNSGRLYLIKQVEDLYKQNIENIRKTLISSCKKENSDQSCELLAGFCTEIADKESCEAIIDGCNMQLDLDEDAGKSNACKYAYINDFNRSCLQIKNLIDTKESKEYSLTYNEDGDFYGAYCDMDGGWTLALKVLGNNTQFTYGSKFWTNELSFNPESTNLFIANHKSQAFNYVPFNFVKVVFRTPINDSKDRVLTIPVNQPSLKDLFAGNYNQTNMTIDHWKDLIDSSDDSLESNCNKQGFNTQGGNLNFAQCRIGIISSTAANCDQPSSYIGVGCKYPLESGSPVAGNFPDSAESDLVQSSFVYIYIK